MAFLSKQACVFPHVLNASDCPPHNVVHECFDYPLYYDRYMIPCIFRITPITPYSFSLKKLFKHFLNCGAWDRRLHAATINNI